MRRFIVIGAGNFLSDIFDIIHANGGRVHKIYQNVPETVRERTISLRERVSLLPYGIAIYDSLAEFEPEEGCEYALGFTVVEKQKVADAMKGRHGLHFSPLVHPEAYVGSNVRMGEGVIVSPRVTISPNTVLNDFVVVNRMASIGHDVEIGDHARIGPSVTLAAFCRIGARTSVNLGAIVLDRVHVGAETVIGAGSLVTKDIPAGVVAYGAPARVIRKKDGN
jgi:sugar O-acyltransferase (sialic acid O-acetyltransferase NeuD family)